MDISAEESTGKPFLTGYFRDGKRRIDLILVAKVTQRENIEQIKMDFLINAIKIGLEMELEGGFDKGVADLIFIKIHAPDNVINHFGYLYNMKKYFKKSHVEFITYNVNQEKKLIKTVRLWYPGPGNYSTIERANIVYRVLLSCPFGQAVNHVGINQLIDKQIFLDVYPLHDGPFNLVMGQTPLELNGRQALYNMWWCGNYNVFVRNPIHMMREYFGERVGFLFMFYQVYNCWLFLLALLGIVLFMSNFANGHYKDTKITLNKSPVEAYTYNTDIISAITDVADTSISDWLWWWERKKRTFTEPELYVCPKCKDFVACPFRTLKHYEMELKFKVFLSNPYNLLLPVAVAIWGILFYLFWRRREYYMYWMWECTVRDTKFLTRPEFRQPLLSLPPQQKRLKVPFSEGDTIKNAKPLEQKKLVVTKQYDERPRIRFCKGFVEIVILMLALLFIVCCYFHLMIRLNRSMLRRVRKVEHIGKFQNVHHLTYFVTYTLGVVHAVCIIIMENLWFKISRWMAKFDEARSEWIHEETHSVNLFGVSLIINITMLSYYAFLKGALYVTPHDGTNWQFPLGLGMDNCGVLTCLDEAFIVFVATFLTKTCIRSIYRLRKTLRDDWVDFTSASDYDPSPAGTPCWEREFHLKPLNENYFWKHLNQILLQYAIVTFFMSCFQLGPFFAFLWNIFYQKYMANTMVKNYRRPLMTQTWGLGGWDHILMVLPIISCFFNCLFIAKHNTLMHIRFFYKYKQGNNFLADYYMGFFDIKTALKSSPAFQSALESYKKAYIKVPDFCLFPGQVKRLITYHASLIGAWRTIHDDKYMPLPGYYYILWHQALIVLILMLIMLLARRFLYSMVSIKPKHVEKYKQVEEAVKKYDITREMALRSPRPPRHSRCPRHSRASRPPRPQSLSQTRPQLLCQTRSQSLSRTRSQTRSPRSTSRCPRACSC